jgi:hypothetical protein
MTITGQALQMRLQLAQLAQKHRPPQTQPVIVPLLPPVDHDLIFEGYASTPDIDAERMRFAARCWMPIKKQNVPLFFRHDKSQIAGKIEDLRIDEKGLYVRALVTHPDARRCNAFSIGATIHNYMLRDVDDSERFHALVTCSTLDEISITDRPSNPAALVKHRFRTCAAVEMYDLIIKKIVCIQKALGLLGEMQRRAAQPRPKVPTPKVHVPPAVVHRPRSEFSMLVQEINREH